MDYLLSDKQSGKAFLWEVSLIVSLITSLLSETISSTITQLDKKCLVMEGFLLPPAYAGKVTKSVCQIANMIGQLK